MREDILTPLKKKCRLSILFYLCKQPSYSTVCIVVSILCIISFPLQLSKTVEDLEDPYLQSEIPSFHYQRYPNI